MEIIYDGSGEIKWRINVKQLWHMHLARQRTNFTMRRRRHRRRNNNNNNEKNTDSRIVSSLNVLKWCAKCLFIRVVTKFLKTNYTWKIDEKRLQ